MGDHLTALVMPVSMVMVSNVMTRMNAPMVLTIAQPTLNAPTSQVALSAHVTKVTRNLQMAKISARTLMNVLVKIFSPTTVMLLQLALIQMDHSLALVMPALLIPMVTELFAIKLMNVPMPVSTTVTHSLHVPTLTLLLIILPDSLAFVMKDMLVMVLLVKTLMSAQMVLHNVQKIPHVLTMMAATTATVMKAIKNQPMAITSAKTSTNAPMAPHNAPKTPHVPTMTVVLIAIATKASHLIPILVFVTLTSFPNASVI